ncbi:hypothetical protein RHGRI_003953 [Rhododendron griersonianum]|uniref:Uncharacterized protein n=1 Tax=Rhododendron griersonianum TaxID=479676 RepID=A0AAV6L7N0_9ERIC|nr:hypothetical protein RHGRI_003953 [Rhododendron griersonianum]
MPLSLAFKVMTLANHVKVKHPAALLVPKDNSKTSPPKVTEQSNTILFFSTHQP